MQCRHFGLEAGVAVEIEVLADAAAVSEDLGSTRVFFDRDVAGLFEQRQIDVALDIAGGAWIAIPVPRAAEVAALFDDANILATDFAQACTDEQTTEAAADHCDFHVVGQRRAGEPRCDIRIVQVVGKVAGDFLILLIAVGAHSLVTLGAVLGP